MEEGTEKKEGKKKKGTTREEKGRIKGREGGGRREVRRWREG